MDFSLGLTSGLGFCSLSEAESIWVAAPPRQNSGAEPRDVALTGYNAMMAGKVETTHGLFNKLITNAAVRILRYRVQAGLVSHTGGI